MTKIEPNTYKHKDKKKYNVSWQSMLKKEKTRKWHDKLEDLPCHFYGFQLYEYDLSFEGYRLTTFVCPLMI